VGPFETRPLAEAARSCTWLCTLDRAIVTREVQKKLIDSVHAEVGSRSIDELEAERDEMLLGLLELRSKAEKAPATPKAAARAG